MAKIHDEIRAMSVSTGWTTIAEGLEARKKQILKQMLDASIYAGLATDTLNENAKKQLYTQHLLKIQYSFIDHLLQIPKTIMNTEIKEEDLKEVYNEYLGSFDSQYPGI